jgi:hypothetical protein
MTRRLPLLPALLVGAFALLLAGCTTLGDIATAESLGICGLIHLALAVYALINIIGSNASTGAKALWVLLVWLLPLLGLIIWFVAGPKR